MFHDAQNEPVPRVFSLEVTEGSGTDIWVYDWQRDTMTRVTFTGNANAPVWSPDGRYIAFRAPGEGGMSVTRSDGSGKPQSLSQSKNAELPYWSSEAPVGSSTPPANCRFRVKGECP